MTVGNWELAWGAFVSIPLLWPRSSHRHCYDDRMRGSTHVDGARGARNSELGSVPVSPGQARPNRTPRGQKYIRHAITVRAERSKGYTAVLHAFLRRRKYDRRTMTGQAERSGGYVAVLLCSALWLRKSLTGHSLFWFVIILFYFLAKPIALVLHLPMRFIYIFS